MKKDKNSRLQTLRWPYMIILLVFIKMPVLLQGAASQPSSVDRLFRLIYDQKFTEAESVLRHSEDLSDSLYYRLLMLDYQWWKAVADESNIDFTEFNKVLAGYSVFTEKEGPRKDLHDLIWYTYSLRLAVKQNHYLSILGNMYKISTLMDRFNPESLKPLEREIFNLYRATFDIGRSKLLFFNPKLRSDGIQALESGMESDQYIIQVMSCYSLARIYSEVDKRCDKALPYYQQLCKQFPGNRNFRLEMIRCKKNGATP